MATQSKAKPAKKRLSRVILNPRSEVLTEEIRGIVTRRSGKFAHYCYDYDEMLIDENDPEFQTCLCGVPNART